MLTFGPVSFQVAEAAYQALTRAARYRTPALERVGSRPAYHFLGPGEESITLTGVIMPTYRGRPAVLDDLRALAGAGEARELTAGTGRVLGRWLLNDVSDERTGLFDNGAARRVAYTLRLVRDDEGPSGRQGALETASAAHGNVAAVVTAVQDAAGAGGDAAAVLAAAEGAA